MSKSQYRPGFQRRILSIIDNNPGLGLKDLKKMIREANPYSYNHQTKIWREETKYCLALRGKISIEGIIKPKHKLLRPDTDAPKLF